jgi:teichuronic acid biosynthesis glycosyltransferase TuaC
LELGDITREKLSRETPNHPAPHGLDPVQPAHTQASPARDRKSLRVLTFTSLFPSAARPRHGIFVETRLRHLIRDCGVDARVVAPVPWFPWTSSMFGKYAAYAATPRRATRDDGLQVSHPRYLMLPKMGVSKQPDNMARAAQSDIQKLIDSGWTPDIIDAHYFYPDGVAAAILSERLGIPFVVTARGTDVNVLGRTPGPAQRILWAAKRAAKVITVSTRLKEALIDLGVEEAKVVVLRNGVDQDTFSPVARAAAREQLSLPKGRLAACVGNLVPEKGFDLAVESLKHLADMRLVIVGDGPMRDALALRARELGVQDRVIFKPVMAQRDLRYLYCAADVLLLTSTREGWPNVVLESLACGTPVVAMDVGAVGEMLTNASVGRIVAARNAQDFAAAIQDMLKSPADPELIRLHAVQFDWAAVSRGQSDVFASVLNQRASLR